MKVKMTEKQFKIAVTLYYEAMDKEVKRIPTIYQDDDDIVPSMLINAFSQFNSFLLYVLNKHGIETNRQLFITNDGYIVD